MTEVHNSAAGQNLSTVFRAEAWRLFGLTRLLVALSATAVLAALSVVGTLELIKLLSNTEPLAMEPAPLALSVGAFVAASLLGVVATLEVSRERLDGTVTSMLRVVPNRFRALMARSLALALLGLCAGLAWVAMAIAYLGAQGGPGFGSSSLVANVIGGVLGIVLCVLVVTLLAVAIQNGILSLLACVLLFLVLPLVVAPLGLFGRLGWSRAGDFILNLLPGSLASNLMAPPLDRPEVALFSLLGMLVWVAVMGALAHLRFSSVS
ncbi:MAG: hypothetical protein IPL41_07185 [Micropruina sp.]|nr:hypothetical protein [Micropruina sp.]